MPRALGMLSLALLATAVTVHVCTFIPALPVSPLWVVPLMLTVFPLFAATVYFTGDLLRRHRPPPSSGMGAFQR